MLFQNWHEEFDKFWLEHSKVSKTFTLMRSFWVKYILLEVKKHGGVIFYDTEKWYKNWIGTDLLLQNRREEFDKFWPEHWKVSKFFTLMGSFWAKYILSEFKKSTEEFFFITMRSDPKFGEELTSHFKIDMRNLWNFDLSTQKSQKVWL